MWGHARIRPDITRYGGSTLQTEAMAALQAIQHATHLGMMHIILQIDVATLTLAMSSTGGTKSTISSLIHHTRDHIDMSLPSLC